MAAVALPSYVVDNDWVNKFKLAVLSSILLNLFKFDAVKDCKVVNLVSILAVYNANVEFLVSKLNKSSTITISSYFFTYLNFVFHFSCFKF